MKKVAIKIETEKWNEIISYLIEDNWTVTLKYYGYDEGIDFDFLILRKGFKKIIFGWEYLDEGEIKCSPKLFEYLENQFDIKFNYGKPDVLSLIMIILFILQSLPLSYLKKANFFEVEEKKDNLKVENNYTIKIEDNKYIIQLKSHNLEELKSDVINVLSKIILNESFNGKVIFKISDKLKLDKYLINKCKFLFEFSKIMYECRNSKIQFEFLHNENVIVPKSKKWWQIQ